MGVGPRRYADRDGGDAAPVRGVGVGRGGQLGSRLQAGPLPRPAGGDQQGVIVIDALSARSVLVTPSPV